MSRVSGTFDDVDGVAAQTTIIIEYVTCEWRRWHRMLCSAWPMSSVRAKNRIVAVSSPPSIRLSANDYRRRECNQHANCMAVTAYRRACIVGRVHNREDWLRNALRPPPCRQQPPQQRRNWTRAARLHYCQIIILWKSNATAAAARKRQLPWD